MTEKSLISAASFAPKHLVFPNSWIGHLPFAAWLIREISPKIFVELGTHSGNSYFSFCQSVHENSLPTKCYAVDTWKGDEHAGYYSEEVFHSVNGYNQANYAEFSRLMRMTFDSAIDYFTDKSIDLLHIDGLHTYEAVKHDFETWLPKVSPEGIILFHDINVREGDFGVWRLWEELQNKYPLTFEFTNSHGLGVVKLENKLQEKILWFFDKHEQQAVKNYFSAIGEKQIDRYEITELRKNITEHNTQITSLNQSILTHSHELELVRRLVAEQEANIISLTEETINRGAWALGLETELNETREKLNEERKKSESLAERDIQITNLTQNINEHEKQILNLIQSLAERDEKIITLDEETVRRGEWGLRLDAELEEVRKRLAETQRSLDDVAKSNSWRITMPLREIWRWLSKPTEQPKRYAKKSLSIAKNLYQKLPLEIETIESHRNVFIKYVPKLLSVTDTRFDGKEKVFFSEEGFEKINVPDIPQEYGFFDSLDNIKNAKTIEINSSDDPVVSVIIPVYGKVGYTLNCLASIAANPPQIPFEVIIIDDCSPDNSFEILTNVKGIHLIKNEENQGFIRSCNKGARIAKGEYVYFLNNDTQVTPSWMDELVRTFHEFPGTGFVGSKLIYPDGTLQEAGGIIWQDGSAWNFGRLQNSQLPVYNYAREVDYCSGASIMIPKVLFDELGGFDENYLPAYCEDSDLALKIRDEGYRVIYQPLSTIIHYEGITSGTNTNEGAKSYQVENTEKLYSRWKEFLSNYQISGVDVDNAKDRRANKRVLVLEHCTPTPDQDAGSVTVYNLLLLLREMDFQVTFIPEDNFLYMPDYTVALQRMGVEVLYAPYITSVEQHLREHGSRYDLAFLFRPSLVERNINKIRYYCPQAKVLYYTHDLHFLRMSREAELLKDEKKATEAEEMKIRELDIIEACDASILVSQQEMELIQEDVSKDKLHILPLILDTPGTEKKFAERRDIVFVGGFQHTPNIDAVKYFVSEILPLVKQTLPDVKFYAVGSNVPDIIKELASDDVMVAGYIKDLASLLDSMRVSVAPLRYGAGVKGKIGTAMSVGLPVVATNLAAEGMSLINGENVLIADSPEKFAKAIVKLYKDEDTWNKLSQKSVLFATNNWGNEIAWKNLSDILLTLDISTSRRHYSLSLYSEYNCTKNEE